MTARKAATPAKGRSRAKPPASPPEAGATSAKIGLRLVSDLVPYVRNARTHSAEQVAQLAGSIVEFGFTNPILADATGVVAGHGRLLAARQLYEAGKRIKLPGGEELPAGTVPVLDCTGWTEAQRRAYVIADNKLALNAGWDTALLMTELDGLTELDFDLALTGFTADEAQAMKDGWEADFEAVQKKLADADRAVFKVSCPVADGDKLREALEAAIAGSGIADVEID